MGVVVDDATRDGSDAGGEKVLAQSEVDAGDTALEELLEPEDVLYMVGCFSTMEGAYA